MINHILLLMDHGKDIIYKVLFCFLIILLLWTFVLSADAERKAYERAQSQNASEHIKRFIYDINNQPGHSISGESIYSSEMLERFYKKKHFHPAWTDGSSRFSNMVEDLIQSIGQAGEHGLLPSYYHLDAIRSRLNHIQNRHGKSLSSGPEDIAELDLLLTDAFLTLGCHYSGGCVDPLKSEVEWHAIRSDPDIDLLLNKALTEMNIQETLERLLPSQEGYWRLRNNLEPYRKIISDGGWPAVPASALLRKGDSAVQLIYAKRRLAVSGDLTGDYKKSGLFDAQLETAVKKFQRRHGLSPDGIIGPDTIEAMNIPAETRLRQIELNLERMRWTAGNLSSRYIRINIADYRLDVIEDGNTVMSMDVIVGKPFWHTPVLSETVTYIVLNPFWNVPESIMVDELIPKIMEDPDYIRNKNIKIFSGWGNDAKEIDPRTIPWYKVAEDQSQYRMRQDPGPLNPLGSIKFMFPNRFNVYLHDTPGKALFSNNVRSFSHGCIRISRPYDLAEYLLRGNSEWTRKNILSAVKERKRQTINLPDPINIYLLYLTAWVDDEGILHFRDDIYGRDERLYKALIEGHPRFTSASKLTFIIH